MMQRGPPIRPTSPINQTSAQTKQKNNKGGRQSTEYLVIISSPTIQPNQTYWPGQLVWLLESFFIVQFLLFKIRTKYSILPILYSIVTAAPTVCPTLPLLVPQGGGCRSICARHRHSGTFTPRPPVPPTRSAVVAAWVHLLVPRTPRLLLHPPPLAPTRHPSWLRALYFFNERGGNPY